MAQLGWHVNINNCISCRACEGACKQEFALPVGVRRRRVIVEEGEEGGVPWKRHITMACFHCARPACLTACPVGRYWKDAAGQQDVNELRSWFGMTGDYTGLVLIRPTSSESSELGVDCIGCKRCMAACPYGAPQWDGESNAMDKCTGCFHRLFPKQGSTLPAARQRPACVVSCTSLALAFGDMSTIETWAPRASGDPLEKTTVPPAGGTDIANPDYTIPSVRFTPQ